MNPRPVNVWPIDSVRLRVEFSNGEMRIFDVSGYLHYPVFKALKDPGYFALCRIEYGTVTWPDGSDFCPDTLYLESQPCS